MVPGRSVFIWVSLLDIRFVHLTKQYGVKNCSGENQTMFSPLVGKGAVRARTKAPVHGSET